MTEGVMSTDDRSGSRVPFVPVSRVMSRKKIAIVAESSMVNLLKTMTNFRNCRRILFSIVIDDCHDRKVKLADEVFPERPLT
jgi:hypothetical protein